MSCAEMALLPTASSLMTPANSLALVSLRAITFSSTVSFETSR